MTSIYVVRDADRAVLDLAPGDVGIRYHHPVEQSADDPEITRIPSYYGSLKERIAALGFSLGDLGDYIPTTAADQQAAPKQKFQIDEPGVLLLPPDPDNGTAVRVADLNQKLIGQKNYVLAAADETIARYQVKDATKITNVINLQQLQGWEVFDFIYSKPDKNWGILLDGVSRRFKLQSSPEQPYVFTTIEDLYIQPYQRVAIDKPGNIHLWLPKVIGEYTKIVDDLELLRTQDNYLWAPAGHVLFGKNVPIDKGLRWLKLSNTRGANNFEVKYAGDNAWRISLVTNNG